MSPPQPPDELASCWQRYLGASDDPDLPEAPYVAETFGDSDELADELVALILDGRKTATCSAVWQWEAEGVTPPQVGHRSIVLDSSGKPRCIIEVEEVRRSKYKDVDAKFAYDEGEKDRSLESWRREHWRFFNRILPEIGKEPHEKMLLVCERFRVVYRW
jgi:uncharacterized protein YhfF